MTDKHTIHALCDAMRGLIPLACKAADPFSGADISAVANAETALARAHEAMSPTGDSIGDVVRRYLGDQYE